MAYNLTGQVGAPDYGFAIICGRVTIGATGAPTLVTSASPGVESITRLSAGHYRVRLGDRSNRIFRVDAGIAHTTGTGYTVEEDSVFTSGAVILRCMGPGTTGVPVAADPANGTTLTFTVFTQQKF